MADNEIGNNKQNPGLTTVSQGPGNLLNQDPQNTKRCISCGAFGPQILCRKHALEFIEAVDYWKEVIENEKVKLDDK